MFQSLYPDLAPKFQDAANAKARSCAAEKAQAAADKARSQRSDPAAVLQAADAARYQTLARLTPDAVVTAAAKPTTIYIQFSDATQRGQALKLQEALKAAHYSAPGVEKVASAPKVAHVRYYHRGQEPAARAAAEAIGKALNIPVPEIQPVPSRYSNLPEGVLEFWFPGTS